MDLTNWKDKKCDVCGKPFGLYDLQSWAYKGTFRNKKSIMCSYSCKRQFEKEKVNAKRRAKKRSVEL